LLQPVLGGPKETVEVFKASKDETRPKQTTIFSMEIPSKIAMEMISMEMMEKLTGNYINW